MGCYQNASAFHSLGCRPDRRVCPQGIDMISRLSPDLLAILQGPLLKSVLDEAEPTTLLEEGVDGALTATMVPSVKGI